MKVDFLIGECPIDFSKVNERSSPGETWEDGDWADAIRIALSGKPVMVRSVRPSRGPPRPPMSPFEKGDILQVMFISSVCDELGFIDPYRDDWMSKSNAFELIRHSDPKPVRMYNVCDVNGCTVTLNDSPEELLPRCPVCGSSCHVIGLDDALERETKETQVRQSRVGDGVFRLGNQYLWQQIVTQINEFERQNNEE